MPWTTEDVEKHVRGLSAKAKKTWINVANSALATCQEKGGEDCEGSAIRQANSVAKKQMEDDEKTYYYLTDISDIQLEEKEGKKSSWIEVFREGEWNHPKWGIIKGTKKMFNDFISNWKSNVLGREISLDKTHEPSDGATGWIQELKIKGDRLLALVEWTPFGIELIEQKGFKYFSPEYRDSYTDKESGKEYKNVLFGGGITNRPFLTDLAPIVLSEDLENQCFKTVNTNELKENFWIALQEYADHDEEKIRNIMDTMKSHMEEAMKATKTKDGEAMIYSIVKGHMRQMMNEIMDQMDWVQHMEKSEVKSNY